MKETSIHEVFLNEAKELLGSVESDCILLEQGGDPEIVNRIFRCAHTLKGSAAIAGFAEVSEFMHGVENLLDKMRSGAITAESRLIDILLASFDWVRLMLFGDSRGADLENRRRMIEQVIKELSVGSSGKAQMNEARKQDAGNARYYRVRARFREDVFASGIDPLSVMEDFLSLGDAVELRVDSSRLPMLEEMDPERCYISWDVTLRSAEPMDKVEACFVFVKDDNRIVIEDVTDRRSCSDTSTDVLEDRKIGEILVREGVVSRKELDEVLAAQESEGGRIGDIVVAKGYATEGEVRAALNEQERIRTRLNVETVRVETRKLDDLMNLLGEIVIGQSSIARIADEMPEEEGFRIKNALHALDRTTREFQERIMSIRMVPIGPTFEQFRRFVRDTARELGKEIRIEIYGEDTELDKTVIEKISDPLKHMIRNAVDHGVEAPDERVSSGKDRQGRIRLNAYHQEGSVIIEVSDDGRGIDPAKIRARAVAQGLLKPDEEVSDSVCYSFLFLPGFTTADEASGLSGRGVGMDVVKTNIEALRGSIEIESAVGEGTTFRIKLPLTLAIIDGMLVRCGSNVFIIPLLSIVECLRPSQGEIERIEGRGELLMVRGSWVPLVRLYDLFEIEGAQKNPYESLVVIAESGSDRIGILVDDLIGQQQIVIKNLGSNVTSSRAVSGAAVLGDGKVALILDIHGLLSDIARR